MPTRAVQLDTPALVADYESGVSALNLSQQLGCSLNTVLRRLRRAGVRVRPPGFRTLPKILRLSPGQIGKFVEIVDGVLLGDGSIVGVSAIAATLRLGQCHVHSEWLDQVQELLLEVGVPCNILEMKPAKHPASIKGRRIQGKGGKLLYTPAFKEFKQQYERWYPNGVKAVPEDVQVTPLSVALWFSGDGAYSKQGSLFFCTQGFSPEDVDRLCLILSDVVHINCRRTNAAEGPIVAITRMADAVRLRDFIQEFVPFCFGYKLENVRQPKARGAHRRKLSVAQITTAHCRIAEGATVRSVASSFGVTRQTMAKVLRKGYYKLGES